MHGLMPLSQSAYRRHHTTVPRKHKLLSDIYTVVDRQQVPLLGLLDWCAAFYCAATTFFYVGFAISLESVGPHLTGSHSFWTVERNRFSTEDEKTLVRKVLAAI